MSEKSQILRFIPFRKADIIEMCLAEGSLPADQHELFRQFCHQIQHIFHYKYYADLENIKNNYALLDPDSDTRQVLLKSQELQQNNQFVNQLKELLERANYEKLSESDLNQALHQDSLFKLKLKVNFEDFEEVLFYFRGESIEQETVVKYFGLKKQLIQFVNYERVLIYIKFSKDFQSHKAALRQYRPGSIMLKLFQNVPKADLEMLFPNTKLQMRLVDKVLIGIPAAVSGGVVLATKLGATLILIGSLIGFWIGLHADPVELDKTALLTLFIGIGALLSYLWKQFSNFKNRKLRFMQTLTKNLYFKNLDNNAGVFHRLLDEAEEEECKETIIAFYFLLVQNTAIDQHTLDKSIEAWFRNQWDYDLNFEIDDAVKKLVELELAKVDNDNFRVQSLTDSIAQLNEYWNNLTAKSF